jgi:tellurite resistance protein TehA-like permease
MLKMRLSPTIVLAIIVLIVLLVWNSQQPPKAYYLINTAPAGISRKELYNIIGAPNSLSEYGVAYYYRPLSFGTLYVVFDDDDIFIRYYYEPY